MIEMVESIRDEMYRDWLAYCYLEAANSPDPSTQNAACLVSPQGTLWPGYSHYNGPTNKWIMRDGDWDRPRKYALVEHAERNCIYLAASHGLKTAGCTMVSCWASCADCARSIVQSGIVRLIRHVREPYSFWNESIDIGDEIMEANGVEIVNVVGCLSDTIPNIPEVLFNGKLVRP